MDLAIAIKRAVSNRTYENAASLTDLVASIDALERILVTREELNTALSRLLELGQIAERDGRLFYDGRNARPFEPLTEAEHLDACQSYVARFGP